MGNLVCPKRKENDNNFETDGKLKSKNKTRENTRLEMALLHFQLE